MSTTVGRRSLIRRTGSLVAAVVVLAALAYGAMSTWLGAPAQHRGISAQQSVQAPLLDRNAERVPEPSPRIGGPGGQVGDAE